MIRRLTILLTVAISISFPIYSQSYSKYFAESNGGLCNQTLLLFKDSTWSLEWGCEGSSHFSQGRWTQSKETLSFTPAKPASMNFIDKVEREKTNDKKITVMVFDKAGKNITRGIKIGQYLSGKGMYLFELDSAGNSKSEWQRGEAKIILISLSRALGKRIEIGSDGSSLYKFYLNIPADWNLQINSEWDDRGVFTLTKKQEQLYSAPDHFDEKGKLVPTVYSLTLDQPE